MARRPTSAYRHLMRLAASFALLLLALAPAAARSQPPLWVVHGPRATVFLFGTVHLAPEHADWRPAALDAALAQADEAWFETDFGAAGRADEGREALARGEGPRGWRLSDHLAPADRTRLKALAGAAGVPQETLEPLLPWYAETTLGVALLRHSGGAGLDYPEQVLTRALQPRTRVRGLETAAEQVNLFAAPPMAEQLASLRQTLRNPDRAVRDYRALARAWLAGDVAAIARSEVTPLRSRQPRLYARLVARRNARWTQEIIRRLAAPGRVVVIVGVGHLVGPEGIPAQLRARGLKVDGP